MRQKEVFGEAFPDTCIAAFMLKMNDEYLLIFVLILFTSVHLNKVFHKLKLLILLSFNTIF